MKRNFNQKQNKQPVLAAIKYSKPKFLLSEIVKWLLFFSITFTCLLVANHLMASTTGGQGELQSVASEWQNEVTTDVVQFCIWTSLAFTIIQLVARFNVYVIIGFFGVVIFVSFIVGFLPNHFSALI